MNTDSNALMRCLRALDYYVRKHYGTDVPEEILALLERAILLASEER